MKKKLVKKQEKRDYYSVILEDVRDGVKGVAEGVSMLNEKVDRMDKRLERVEADLNILKGEVALIRHNQVTRDEFKMLEIRVLRLEKKYSTR